MRIPSSFARPRARLIGVAALEHIGQSALPDSDDSAPLSAARRSF
jgi:hypothetical protein